MEILVFEPFSGASGDMILAALLDIGADFSRVAEIVSSLEPCLKMSVNTEERGGIVARRVYFVDKRGGKIEKRRCSYKEMVERIENSGLDDEVVKHSLSILEIMMDAEAKVHNKRVEDLDLHEIGSLDTIVDIVANSVAFLDIQSQHGGDLKILSTPISVGAGFVKTEHGLLPVPAPASMEILKNHSLLFKGGPVEEELLTPTGAAILAHFVHRSVPFMPMMHAKNVGYGGGSKNLDIPNVLRVVIGEAKEEEEVLMSDEVEVLETNVDDVTGEVLGNLIEVLMGEGAKDVAIIPAMMKKGRVGHVIKVITSVKDSQRIAYRMMEETGSLGVRVMRVNKRFVADREEREVKVKIRGVERGVKVKIGKDRRGRILSISTEYEDAKRVARELKVPVKEVMKIAEEKVRDATPELLKN
ncbi:MAG: nickel pincer cofactor biosynthesis protein LarC [Candidatus Methanospirareceae archaeon]